MNYISKTMVRHRERIAENLENLLRSKEPCKQNEQGGKLQRKNQKLRECGYRRRTKRSHNLVCKNVARAMTGNSKPVAQRNATHLRWMNF
jgi:hypothetical protein